MFKGKGQKWSQPLSIHDMIGPAYMTQACTVGQRYNKFKNIKYLGEGGGYDYRPLITATEFIKCFKTL